MPVKSDYPFLTPEHCAIVNSLFTLGVMQTAKKM